MREKTILSAGLLLHKLLSENLKGKVTKVYPVATDEAILPYIAYRRNSLEHKAGKPEGADTAQVEIHCFSATYGGSVELAEEVVKILHYAQSELDGLQLRSATLTDSEEFFEADAFVQVLRFTIKV